MKIKYESVTGEVTEIEVEEELAEVCIEIEYNLKNQNQRESRRHVLLSVLECRGIQISDKTNIVNEIIDRDKLNNLQIALKRLLPKQQELIFKVFFCEKTIVEIAKEEGVTPKAIRNRLDKIYRKLKEIMS